MDYFRDSAMIIMFIIIIFLIYNQNKISNKSKQENFTSDELSSVRNEINKIYNMDVEAIRNLGTISKSLLTGTNYHSTDVGTPGDLTIPADNTIFNGNQKIKGDITVDGKIVFTNKDTLLMDIFPSGMIISFNGMIPPLGWTLCDGLNGAPDLRGRFILGSGEGSGLTNRDINNMGGEETHTLTIAEIPSHTHFTVEGHTSINSAGTYTHRPIASALSQAIYSNYSLASGTGEANLGLSSNTGSSQPHNNMPPFYVLTYIMKL
jgi:microcystin-dependent protein